MLDGGGGGMTVEQLIERVKDSILRDVDGNWHFWPSESAGSWPSWALRVIAEELDKRNREDECK